MRTQYFLMLPASFQRETKRLILLLNVGIITATSLPAGSAVDDINIILQDNALAEISPCVRAQAFNLTSEMKTLFQPDAAYWCTRNTSANKNTSSS